MAVTIITKIPLPIGADPAALKKLDLCKAFGVIFPRSNGGDAENEALLAQYGKALKFEATLKAKCSLELTKGPTAFKKMAKTYLSNKRCLLVALFEDNARQDLQDRLSLEQLMVLANQYQVLTSLSEPARIWQEPKSSGKGMRVICSFGPVARAAQRMVVKLLRLTYQPQDFQFTHLGFAQKVQRAMSLIKEKGYTHQTEIDIKDFFPSFTEEALVDALPLPKGATRQIVLAKSASWGPHPYYAKHGYILSPPGIPQGSASSAEVAHWCIANMSMGKIVGADIINHADNFFIFAAAPHLMDDASKALSSGIAGLPGGDFIGKTEQTGKVAEGFRMLGCWVSTTKTGELQADPTEANLNKLRTRAYRQRQRAVSKLAAAKANNAVGIRISGLQDFLRLESMINGWVNAFDCCGPHIKDIANHYSIELDLIRHRFEITRAELEPLIDASTIVTIKWYSGK